MTRCNRHGVNNWLLNCEPIWFGIFMKIFRHTSKNTTNFQHFFCENQEFDRFIYTEQRQSAVTNPNHYVLGPSRCELVNHNLIVHRFHSKIDNFMKNSPSHFKFFWKHVFLTINFSGASQFLHNDRVGPKLSNWERFEKKSQKCQNRVIILQNLFPSQNTFWALDKIVQPKKIDNSSK